MKLKKISFVVLSLALVVSALTGCNRNKGNEVESETVTGTTEPTTAGEAKKEEETVTINLMANLSPAQNSRIGQETIKKLEEKFNIKLNFDIPPSANYAERVQIAVSSGELPDAILFDDTGDTLLKSGALNGTFIDISTYLQDAPNIIQHTLPESLNAVRYMNDDEIFGITRSTLVRADGLALRSDWLEKLGITGVEEGKPITLNKFTEIMQKFSENDPDGNGKNDTYGMKAFVGPDGELVPLSTASNIDVIGGAFGLCGWQEAVGEDYTYMDPRYSKKSDNFKKLMEFLNEMVENKWMDPDWPTMKSAQANDNFNKGKYGCMVAFPTNVDFSVQKLQEVNPEANLIWIPGIINPEVGEVTGTTFATGAWGCWAITKDCKNPEKLVQLFDYMLSDEFYYDDLMDGGEGVGYNTVDGKKVPTEDYKSTDSVGWNRSMVRRASDTAVYLKLTYDDATNQKYNDQIDTSVSNAVISLDGGYIPDIATDAKFIDYKTKMNTTITKIILGELPSSAYDEILDGWYEAGGEEYIKDMNAHITAMSGK